MSKIDIAKQAETLSRLRDELSRLNRQFADTKKALGYDEDVTVDMTEVPAQLAEALKIAEDNAVKAGRNAVASLRCESEEPAVRPSLRRRGTLAI